MRSRVDEILGSRADRIRKYQIEEVKNNKHIKRVEERIKEFASMNHILSEKIIIEAPKAPEPKVDKKAFIQTRIKALSIVLKRKKDKEKTRLETRISGLKIILKRLK